VLGIVELLALEGALWSGVVVVAPVAGAFCAAVPTVLDDVSLATGGVEPEVEAWLPLLLIAELLEELGAEPLGDAAAAPVALWSGGGVLGLPLVPVVLEGLLPQVSEIMLTEVTLKVLLSVWVPFTST